MDQPKITPLQANEIFELVKQAELDPAEFEWQHDGLKSTLVHTPTGFHFCVDPSSDVDRLFITCSPYAGEIQFADYRDTWERAGGVVKAWVTALKRNVAVPDLWNLIGAERALPTAAVELEDNDPFSTDEQQSVAVAIGEIERYLLTVLKPDLGPKQKDVVRREATFQETAATRLGKRDWLNGTQGFLMNLIIAASLTGDEIPALFRFAGEQLGHGLSFLIEQAGKLS